MTEKAFQLSIEELAFSMGVLGGAEVASAFLMAALGDVSKQEIESRLLAASHSLIAREYLSLEGERKRMDNTLASLVKTLIGNKFSLRCSRSISGVEQVFSYFCHENMIVECRTVKEVACIIEEIPDCELAEERSRRFFGLPDGIVSEGKESALGTIPVGILERLKDGVPGLTKEDMVSLLRGTALSAELSEEVADDFLCSEFRGSIIRIENDSAQIVANRGTLILKGPRRFWIFKLTPQDPFAVKVFRGTASRYRESFHELFATE